jgi:protein HOOK3
VCWQEWEKRRRRTDSTRSCSHLVHLVGKDKLEIVEELRNSVNLEKSELERRLLHAEEDVKSKEEQLRMNVSQINTLLMEKVDLQGDSIEQRDAALNHEKEMAVLRASLSNDTSDESSQEQVVLLAKEAEIKRIQENLQKARMLLRHQDKLIQEANNKTSATPEDVLRRITEVERENALLRQESKLVLSAWYDVNTRLNRETLMSGGAFRRNANNRAQTKAGASLAGNKPKSWLQLQRNELSGGISLARR